MWFSRIDRSSCLDHFWLVSQSGSCWCQTKLWQRRSCPAFLLGTTIWSPSVKLKTLCAGSMLTHFWPLAGVTWLNSDLLKAMEVYCLLSRTTLSMAVPKYFRPAFFARSARPGAGFGFCEVG